MILHWYLHPDYGCSSEPAGPPELRTSPQHTLPGDNFQAGFTLGSQVTLPQIRGKGDWYHCPASVGNWTFLCIQPAKRYSGGHHLMVVP